MSLPWQPKIWIRYCEALYLASGFLASLSELQVWPRSELVQCFYGCKMLYGTLDGLVEKPTDTDFIEDIRSKASANLHHARHYLLYPHELSEVVHSYTTRSRTVSMRCSRGWLYVMGNLSHARMIF